MNKVQSFDEGSQIFSATLQLAAFEADCAEPWLGTVVDLRFSEPVSDSDVSWELSLDTPL